MRLQIAPVEGFEGLYDVDAHGNVYSRDRIVNHPHGIAVKRGKRLSPEVNKHGYNRVLLIDYEGRRCHKLVHRLVAEAFLDNEYNLAQVNHIDGNKSNNDVLNLEWVDARDNNRHAVQEGLRTGDKHGIYCTIDGVTYKSISHAARALNTSRYFVEKMMESNDYPKGE